MALGLDKDDSVIRRRLRQKLEFVSDDIAAQAEPTDADLNAYLQAHPESFRVEPRFTFRQVYLDPESTAITSRVTPRNCWRSCSRPAPRPISRRWATRSCSSTRFPSVPAERGRETVRGRVRGEAGRTSARPMAGAGRVRLRRAPRAGQRTHGRTPARAGGRARCRAPGVGERPAAGRGTRSSTRPAEALHRDNRGPEPAKEQKKLAEAK